MDQLFIEIELRTNDNSEIFTTIPSFLALYVFRYVNKPENIKLNFVSSKIPPGTGKIKLRSEALRQELTKDRIISKEAAKEMAILDLRLPVYGKDGDTFIAGMCAVCREIVHRQKNDKLHKLLGFKGSCLLAPSEASIWTRFCEVNVVKALSNQLQCLDIGKDFGEMPVECVRFENHMNEPVRMHNIYKLAREKANNPNSIRDVNKNVKNDKRLKTKITIECTVPKEQLAIEHRFAEGVSFTIADLILYPCFSLVYNSFPGMLKHFPLTSRWLKVIDEFDPMCKQNLVEFCRLPNVDSCLIKDTLKIPESDATSLYKSDPKRYKPRSRLFTEQKEIDIVLNKLKNLSIDFTSNSKVTYGHFNVEWEKIEPCHAESSSLPRERLLRKRQQLENLANAVVSMSSPGDRIVDFCSGTGHLGILLALQLPRCTIILLENKAISLQKAKQRALDLKLKNLLFYQCNIDYFEGKFNTGTSLHACGTATDIVLQQCYRAKANFVTCPCCYGSLQPMPHIEYPLSNLFKGILKEREFMYIAHTADQAHALGTLNCTPETSKQGQLCMDIVDTDRKLQAEQLGYVVILTQLKPESCTPKNRLLVGKHPKNLKL